MFWLELTVVYYSYQKIANSKPNIDSVTDNDIVFNDMISTEQTCALFDETHHEKLWVCEWFPICLIYVSDMCIWTLLSYAQEWMYRKEYVHTHMCTHTQTHTHTCTAVIIAYITLMYIKSYQRKKSIQQYVLFFSQSVCSSVSCNMNLACRILSLHS